MSTWLVVWLVLTLLSTLAFGAVVFGLVRQGLVLTRSMRRFTEEVGPLTADLADEGGRAAERGANLEVPGRSTRRSGSPGYD